MVSHYKVGKPIPSTLISRTVDYKEFVAKANTLANENLLKSDFSTQESCPICGGEPHPLARIQGIPYLTCNVCMHIFSMVVPSIEFLNNHYNSNGQTLAASHQRKTYVLEGASRKTRQIGIESLKAEYIATGIGDSKKLKWVDIGSGSGMLLASARDLGFSVLGIEMDEVLAKHAEENGIPTVLKEVSASNVPNELNDAQIISILNVLEHIPDPTLFLGALVEAVNYGTLVAVEVPRAESLSTIFNMYAPDQTCRHITPPEHLHVFSDLSISHLLAIVGLDHVGTWNFGSDALSVFESVHGDVDAFFMSSDSHSLVNKLQSIIDKRGLSDNRIVLARKR